MAHTFHIRFARSAGLAGLLEAPLNPYRWRGTGRLSIDPQGVVIAARRSLTSLLLNPSSRRIDAADLTEVYREGAALRLEYSTGAGTREIVPFWARDPKTAADIVRHMPTQRTVEMEGMSKAPPPFRWDRRLLAVALAVLAGIALTAWWARTPERVAEAPAPAAVAPRTEPTPVGVVESPVNPPALASAETAPQTATPAAQVQPLEPEWQTMPVAVQPPRLPPYVSLDVQPIPRGTPAYAAGRQALEKLNAVTAALRDEFRAQYALFQTSALTKEQFTEVLGSLEMRWWNLTYEIFAMDALTAEDLLGLRAAMLASARHWRGFLDDYAEALAKLDHVAIAESFDRMIIAEELQERARRFAPP